MKKLSSILICFLLLISQVQLASANTGGAVTVEVAVDSHTYKAGNKVNIVGKVLLKGQAGKSLNPTLVVADSSGISVYVSQWNENEISGDGSISTAFTLSSDAAPGEYVVTVSAGSEKATTGFTVESGGPGDAVSNAKVTVQTNKSQYNTNESVSITGNVSDNGKGVSGVVVTVLVSKDGNQLKADQVYTNKNGNYNSYINLTSKDKDGTYQVKVKSLKKEAEATFTVKETIVPGPGSGGGSGGGSNPGIPGPGTPSPAEPSKGPEKLVVVKDSDLSKDLADPAKKVVEVQLKGDKDKPAATLSAELGAATINKLLESNKPLKISTEEGSLQFSPRLLKGLAVKDTVKISIGTEKADASKLPVMIKGQKFVGNIYDFSITVGKDQKVSNFAEPVQVSLKVDAEQITSPKKASAYYLNETSQQWEYKGGKLVKDEWVFNTTHFSKYTVIENNKTFKDVPAQNWAKEYIETLASRTIIKGKTEDAFGANEQITRAQFAVLLARALQLPQQNHQGTFKDVPASLDWSAKEIEAASRAGIVLGDNGKFNPNANITREQMATMIIRAIEHTNSEKLAGVEGKSLFSDSQSIADYAKDSVNKAAALDIINGKTVKDQVVFAPKENATRAEATKMLYKLLETLDEM